MAERFTKPGTANVSPADRAKLAPLLKHYGKMAHPFTACLRDQIKHGLSKGHAARRCAVLKDLIHGGPGWRKGGKKNLSVSELREVVEFADASGMDCAPLRELRRRLELAEQREALDLAEPGVVSYRITRGPRKGQVVRGRIGADGKFREVKTNTQKGNPRAGLKYEVTTNAKGQPVHRYRINGKTVDVVMKPKGKKRRAKAVTNMSSRRYVRDSEGKFAETGSGGSRASDNDPPEVAAIQRVLPGANVRKTKHGLEVGGFSKPRPEARRLLEAAGLEVKDVWGTLVVVPKKK